MWYFASIWWSVDDYVISKKKTERQQSGGLVAIFLDPDGDEFTVVEDHEHYTRASGQTSHM